MAMPDTQVTQRQRLAISKAISEQTCKARRAVKSCRDKMESVWSRISPAAAETFLSIPTLMLVTASPTGEFELELHEALKTPAVEHAVGILLSCLGHAMASHHKAEGEQQQHSVLVALQALHLP